VWQRPKEKLPHADLVCNFYTSMDFQSNLVSISPTFLPAFFTRFSRAKTLVKSTPRVDFANVLHQKCKKDLRLECIFALLGSASVKAARKMLVKLTPHWFWSISVITLKMEWNKYMLKYRVPISPKANTECIKDLD
jgi:hypothetical protein